MRHAGPAAARDARSASSPAGATAFLQLRLPGGLPAPCQAADCTSGAWRACGASMGDSA